jgi:hypothetical protein
MISNITAYRIANTIRMQRSQYSGAFLIVEGGVTDLRVYGRFIDRTTCQPVVAHSKDNAVNALGILEQESFPGVLAVVDADFWVLEGKPSASPNLLLTDTHDLETMILKSPALEKFLAEYGSEDKISNFTGQRGKDVREILVESGIPVGYLRWVSLQDSLSLKFEGLSFNRFVNDRTLAVDEAGLIRTVKNHSQKPQLDEKNIQNRMTSLKNDMHDPWHICCGHDLICILSLGLRRILGSHDTREIEPELIEKILRLAYEQAHFLMTQIYKSIKAWENVNSPFRILLAI